MTSNALANELETYFDDTAALINRFNCIVAFNVFSLSQGTSDSIIADIQKQHRRHLETLIELLESLCYPA